MKRGVEVAEIVWVEVVDGKGVYRIWARGGEVADAEDVFAPVIVVVAVMVTEDVFEPVGVEVVVGGAAVGLTEAASLPTVRSTPQTWGNDRVAE
jgi:hypothetical protein